MSIDHTIAILGGGPIGLTCALLFAQRGLASLIVDARTIDEARRDMRLLALSRGTWQVLEPLLGSAVPRRAAIREVQVSSAGEFGATHLSAADFGGDDLGATVLYGELLEALARAAASQPLIEQRRRCRALRVEQTPDRVRIGLDDASSITASIAVRAEGVGSGGTSGASGTNEVQASAARQAAVLADVRISGPGAGDAFERFTREGPLALLPTPAALPGDGGRTMSLVWCMDAQQAERRLALDAEAFQVELQRAIGPRIGAVRAIGARRTYSLQQTLRDHVREHRVVALGNAAQALHPVAGQGFNLGVRDCVTLVDALAAALADGSADLASALGDYEARRRLDRAAISTLTRWLPPAFATRFAPLALARSAGLTALDLLPPLRRQLAHLLMFGARA